MQSLLDYLPEFLLGATFVTGLILVYDLALASTVPVAVAAPSRNADAEDGDAFGHAREELLREPPLMEWGSFFPVLAIVLVLRSFVVEPFGFRRAR